MKRITINVPDELAAELKERAARTGVRQAELIRRACNIIFVDGKAAREASKKAQAIIEATGGPKALPHWSEV
jgi:metal-responsive CopG/Arc/MetJ family transcriptional regulator